MKHLILISAIAFVSVALSVFMGQSEQAGLFGAVIGCSWYAATIRNRGQA
jgi:hypothetical protein